MKNAYKKLVVLVAISIIFIGKVNATDLTSSITANDGLGGLTTFTKTYDAENDVNNLKVSLVVNEDSINTILNQKPGVGGKLGVFYLGISPNTGNTPVYKENYYFYHTDTKTVNEIKTAILDRIGEDDLSSNETVWIHGVGILYFDGTTWKQSDSNGDGTTSIKQDLMNKLGLIDESELKYGENYRFFMYNNLDWWMVWSDKNPNVEEPTKVEFIKVSYEILFPIKSTDGNTSVYHTSLEDAVQNGYDNIVINKDTTLPNDLVVPESKKITISKDATLTIPESSSLKFEGDYNLTGEGNLVNNGTIYSENKEVFFITVTDSENGFISVQKNAYPSDSEVTINITPNNGYELDTFKVIDSDGKEVVVTNGKFVIKSDVNISATFKEIVELPPDTADINLPLIISVLSIAGVGMILGYKKLLKKC
ncbi:MAG: hypothetical protein ACI4XR_05980 [Bacilli bacterium]